jgi:ElaA protein
LGIGKALMQYSIQECERLFGKGPIKIGAQLYLKKFYNEQGFEQSGDVYLEDEIDHIPMIREEK